MQIIQLAGFQKFFPPSPAALCLLFNCHLEQKQILERHKLLITEAKKKFNQSNLENWVASNLSILAV